MTNQSPLLTIDGDLNRAKRKLSGESLADEVWPQGGRSRSPLLPDPQNFNSPQAQRAPASAAAPSLAGSIADPDFGRAAPSTWDGVKAAVSPLVNPLTPLDLLTAVPRDAARNAAIRVAGGDPATASGGATKYSDAAFGRIQPTIEAFNTGVDATGRRVSRGILDATGASLAAPAAPSIKGSIADPDFGRASPQATSQADGAGQGAQRPGGIADPWFKTDSGIAARRGANGIPEFSNDRTALDSAQPMPAGGMGGQQPRRPGVLSIADDVPLAQRGSINNIGNGIGTFSQGQAGDAANAIAQFDAANAIRREQLPGVRVAGTGYQNPLTAGQLAQQRQQDRRDAARQELSLRERELGIQERRGIADDQVAQRNAQFEQQKLAQQGESSQQKLLGDLARAYGSMANRPQVELGDGKARDVTFEEWARPMLGGIGRAVLSRGSVTRAEVEQTAKARGVSEEQVIEMLRGVGVSVSR